MPKRSEPAADVENPVENVENQTEPDENQTEPEANQSEPDAQPITAQLPPETIAEIEKINDKLDKIETIIRGLLNHDVPPAQIDPPAQHIRKYL